MRIVSLARKKNQRELKELTGVQNTESAGLVEKNIQIVSSSPGKSVNYLAIVHIFNITDNIFD